MPPEIHNIASPDATSGWRAAVSSETRGAARTADDHRGRRGRAARAARRARSACIADSDAPVKQTSEAPVFGRSQITHPVTAGGERLGELADAGRVFGEPAAGGDRPTASTGGGSPMIS